MSRISDPRTPDRPLTDAWPGGSAVRGIEGREAWMTMRGDERRGEEMRGGDDH